VEHVGRPRTGDMLKEGSGGHVMKLRYTPVQRDVLAVEEPASPHHEVMAEAVSLDGAPVICCGLHSQMPLAAAAAKFARPDARIAYVMTDQASLPIALSDVVRKSLVTGLIDTTFTCGQAFGGQFEAVTLHSALLAARHVAHADLIIVGVGPGVVGTATPFGHSGVAQGEAINAVAALDGAPIATLRLSFHDARERHNGVSHHTLTALGSIAFAAATVAIPVLPPLEAAAVEEALDSAGIFDLHERAYVEFDLAEAIAAVGFEVRTMGRGPAEDPAFYAAAAAAGYHLDLSAYHD